MFWPRKFGLHCNLKLNISNFKSSSLREEFVTMMNNSGHILSFTARALLWLFACCQYCSFSLPVSSKKELDLAPATIIWNPVASQQTFSSKKTLNVLQHQTINIVCPNAAIVPGVDVDQMYENIWFVDKKGFETCSVNRSNPNHYSLLNCWNTTSIRFGRIAFDPFTKSGRSFEPGKTYYIIATSTGAKSSLNNTRGGNCLKNNMKIAFYVCRNRKGGRIDRRCQKVAKKSKECTSNKQRRMKQVVRKLEGVSQTLGNNSKQLVNLVGNSEDMDGKIEAILEMVNSTRQAKPRKFRKEVLLTLTLRDVELKEGEEDKNELIADKSSTNSSSIEKVKNKN